MTNTKPEKLPIQEVGFHTCQEHTRLLQNLWGDPPLARKFTKHKKETKIEKNHPKTVTTDFPTQ